MAGNKSATLTIVIAGDAKGLSQSLKGTETQVASLGATFKKLTGAIGIGLGTAAVLKFGKDSVAAFKSGAAEVIKLKRLTGETTEQANLLRFAAQQTGIGTEKMAKAWVIFSKNVESGKVEKLGIDLHGANGEMVNSEQMLGRVADKFASMKDGTEKTALAVNIFGRAGADLLPMLNKGSAGIAALETEMKRLGFAIDDEGIKKYKDYVAAQRDFQAASAALKQTVGQDLLPVLTKLATVGAEDLPKVIKVIEGISGAVAKFTEVTGLQDLAGVLAPVAPALVAAGVAVTGVGAAINLFGPAVSTGIAAVKGLGVALGIIQPAAAAAGTATGALAAEEVAATTATVGLSTALSLLVPILGIGAAAHFAQGLSDAVDSAEKLQAASDETKIKLALMWQATNPDAFKQAGRESIDTLLQMKAAADAAGVKIPELEQAIAELKAEQIAEAAATEGQVSAFDKLQGKAADVGSVLESLKNVQTELKSSQTDMGEAMLDVVSAQKAAEQAARDITSAEHDAAAADRAVIDAKAGVQSAIEGVAAARRAEEANIKALVEAEKGEAEAVADIADAEANLAQKRREATGDSDAMRSALEGVARAEDALRQADEDALSAQERLTAARANYAQTVADLQDKALSATLDVHDAERRKREADAALLALKPDATADERSAAADAVTRAEIGLRQALKDEAAAAAEANKEAAAGVEGSTAVVDAKDDVEAALRRQEQAHKDLKVSVQNVADTQVLADAQVAIAEDNVRQKIDARQAAHDRVVAAKQSVVDGNAAIRAAVDQVAKAEQGVADAAWAANAAHQTVVDKKDAYNSATAEITAKQNDLAAAMERTNKALHERELFFASSKMATYLHNLFPEGITPAVAAVLGMLGFEAPGVGGGKSMPSKPSGTKSAPKGKSLPGIASKSGMVSTADGGYKSAVIGALDPNGGGVKDGDGGTVVTDGVITSDPSGRGYAIRDGAHKWTRPRRSNPITVNVQHLDPAAVGSVVVDRIGWQLSLMGAR